MGRAYMQCELRHLSEGTKKDLRFRSDDTVERADLDTPRKMQVLYTDGGAVHVMDQTTFEQSEIPLATLGDSAKFIQVRVRTVEGSAHARTHARQLWL
jgi:elongation factor P